MMTENLAITSGIRQRNELSTIFNLILHQVLKDLYNDGHIMCRSYQVLAYADDVAILARSLRSMNETFRKLDNRAKEVGLQINIKKTKYLKMTAGVKREDRRKISVAGYTFESVRSFTYLGAYLNSTNNMHDKIFHRIISANKAYYVFAKLFRSSLILRTCKLTMYKTLIRTVLCYNAETWILTASDEEKLKTFERKILRKILGPIKEGSSNYRIRFNHEILQVMDGEDIVRFVKAQRLRWLGHVERMSEDKTVKRAYEAFCMSTRKRGRPRMQWREEVERNLRKISVTGWREAAGNKDVLKQIVL